MALLVLSILLIAGLLRFLAWPQSFWFDEVATTRFIQEPLSHLWSDWMRRETNPPLYYTTLKGWSALFGRSDAALRGLSLFYEALSIGLAFLIGCKVAGSRAGLVAAALFAVSPAQIHYSLEVRAYAQAQMAALAALLGILIFCDPGAVRTRRAALALYAFGAIIACYSHTLLALFPALVGAWGFYWLYFRQKAGRAILSEWVMAHAVIFLFCAWWFLLTVWHLQYAPNFSWIPEPTPIAAAKYLLKTYGPDHADAYGEFTAYLILSAAIVPMVVFTVWMARAARSTPAQVLAVCALLSPVILFLLSLATPLMLPRTLFWSSGVMLICYALGYAAMPHRRAAAVLLAMLLAAFFMGAVSLAISEPEEPIERIAATLDAEFAGTDVVTSDKTLAFGLQRYCPGEDCSFNLASREAFETFAADMPMAQVDDAALVGLACRGKLVTVIRVPRPRPDTMLGKVAIPVDLTRHFSPYDLYKVTRWIPRSGNGKACEAASRGIWPRSSLQESGREAGRRRSTSGYWQ